MTMIALLIKTQKVFHDKIRALTIKMEKAIVRYGLNGLKKISVTTQRKPKNGTGMVTSSDALIKKIDLKKAKVKRVTLSN